MAGARIGDVTLSLIGIAVDFEKSLCRAVELRLPPGGVSITTCWATYYSM